MRRGRAFWGMVLLLAGVLLLLNNFDLLPANFSQIFWPSLIFLMGLWILFRGSLFQREIPVDELTLPRGTAQRARFQLKHGAGRIEIRAGAEQTELLRGTFAGGVFHRYQESGGLAEVRLSVPSDGWLDFPWGSGRGFEWSIALPEDLPMELSVEAGAGELDLDLGGLQVTRLDLSTGASSSNIQLPAGVKECLVKVEAGAASVRLRVPPEVEARVRTEVGLAEVDVDPSRFHRSGNEYQTAGFEGASRRIDIKVEAGVSSVHIS